MRVTDRSRIEEFYKCARKRYWGYEYHGRGLTAEGATPVDLAYGLAFHEGAELLVHGASLEDALLAGRVHTDKITGDTVDRLPMKDEYYALLYGHLRGLHDYFLPRFLARYEVLITETEMVMDLSPSLKGMFRLDMGARDKETGLAYNVEWKTSSYPSDIQSEMEYHIQLLLEAKALANHLGEYVAGTIIIGVDKGINKEPLAVDKAIGNTIGKRRFSPYTYCYTNGTAFGGSYSKYSIKYKPNWTITPVWEKFGIENWYATLLAEGLDPLETFVETPPVLYNEGKFNNLLEQVVAMEERIAAGGSMNATYPQNFSNCKNDGGFRRACQFVDLCHNNVSPNDGAFIYRVPNHPLETTIREAYVVE